LLGFWVGLLLDFGLGGYGLGGDWSVACGGLAVCDGIWALVGWGVEWKSEFVVECGDLAAREFEGNFRHVLVGFVSGVGFFTGFGLN
jgi:hypothetical protein